MINPLTITEMNKIEITPNTKAWKIYKAVWVHARNEEGVAVKDYLHLEPIPGAGEHPNFTSAYAIMNNIIRQNLERKHDASLILSSRTENYCVDIFSASAKTFSYAETHKPDCYDRERCYIDIIATTENISLKETE